MFHHAISIHKYHTVKMGRLGFEPRTNRLKAEYSTVELATLTIQSLLPFLARVIILPRLFKKDHHN